MADGSIYGPLPMSIVKGLNDKLYEKRKNAALETEKLVKTLVQAGERQKTMLLLGVVRKEFVYSANANSRKGGLIALAASAIALGQSDSGIAQYLPELVPPILQCFGDADPRVRYYACESMYNVTKVARADVLIFFNRIFDGLCKLAADTEPSVTNGAELLDRLVKDIVTESPTFDVAKFVPLLSERIYAINPSVRQFLVSWLQVLDAVPEIQMLDFLPNFLNGLLKILSDPNAEIRKMCEAIIGEFLKGIEKEEAENFDYKAVTTILIAYCQSDDLLTQTIAVRWINAIIKLAKDSMLEFTSQIIDGILSLLSFEVDVKLRELAITTNQTLMKLVSESDLLNEGSGFNIQETLHVLIRQLLHNSVNTRLATLRWILKLHMLIPSQIYECADIFVPALLKTLSDPADKVLLLDLELFAEMSSFTEGDGQEKNANSFYHSFMLNLMSLFSTDHELLENRCSFIIRNLSLFLSPEKIYEEVSGILRCEDDLEFASLMVQTLNAILLTSTEMHGLRQKLRSMATPESREFFGVLYKSWSHSSVATFSLCLLAQVYDHACDLLMTFSELEVTVQFLVEVDKLIQLLESPIFTYLRLQLLEPQRHAYLVKCLYGLLMLLPQSTAYHTLRNRLDCVPTIIHTLSALETTSSKQLPQKGNINTDIDFKSLLDHFDSVQKRHREAHAQNHQARTDFIEKLS